MTARALGGRSAALGRVRCAAYTQRKVPVMQLISAHGGCRAERALPAPAPPGPSGGVCHALTASTDHCTGLMRIQGHQGRTRVPGCTRPVGRGVPRLDGQHRPLHRPHAYPGHRALLHQGRTRVPGCFPAFLRDRETGHGLVLSLTLPQLRVPRTELEWGRHRVPGAYGKWGFQQNVGQGKG